MTKTRCITLGKFERNALNEDAAIARKNMIAVSDGAGGGGLFADRWSKYLLRKLPVKPITSAEHLDDWISMIWEEYYNKAEEAAKRLGGMALDKFYDEGSFATIAAVWRLPDDSCRWMTYGDSVVFHYDYATKELTHSFSSLVDFNNHPYLVNCKDDLNLSGFRSGEFRLKKDSFVFVASDALSHYIMMMYEVSKQNEFEIELNTAISSSSKNSNLLKTCVELPPYKFEKEVIDKLRKAAYNKNLYKKWLSNLYRNGLLALDDYSIAIMYQ